MGPRSQSWVAAYSHLQPFTAHQHYTYSMATCFFFFLGATKYCQCVTYPLQHFLAIHESWN
jgi:hypothetical protein